MLLIKITAENNFVPRNIPTFLCPLILDVRDYEYLGKGGKEMENTTKVKWNIL